MSPMRSSRFARLAQCVVVAACLLLAFACSAAHAAGETPLMVRIQPTGKSPTSYVITYTTGSSASEDVQKDGRYTTTPKTHLYYGPSAKDMSVTKEGSSKRFETEKYTADIHTVVVEDMKAGSKYYYQVGDSSLPNGLSATFSFTAGPVKRWAIYGDYGFTNIEQSLDPLYKDAKAGVFDGVMHVGDIAYDLHNGKGLRGDQFLGAMEPLSANMPYVYVPGNHEKEGNFSHYLNRFQALEHLGKNSKSNTALWWSVDIPNAHVVTIDTEVYSYFPDEKQQQRQLAWLEADLIAANKKRAQYPWLIMLGHKCDWQDEVDFTDFRLLAHKYGVDVHICGHQHNYQRLYPGLRRKVDAQASPNAFNNPKYWIQIVVGSPGCQEKISKGIAPYKDGVANYFLSYGYGVFSVPNATHFLWEWRQTNRASVTNADSVETARAIFEQNKLRLGAEAEVKDTMVVYQPNHGMRPDPTNELLEMEQEDTLAAAAANVGL